MPRRGGQHENVVLISFTLRRWCFGSLSKWRPAHEELGGRGSRGQAPHQGRLAGPIPAATGCSPGPHAWPSTLPEEKVGNRHGSPGLQEDALLLNNTIFQNKKRLEKSEKHMPVEPQQPQYPSFSLSQDLACICVFIPLCLSPSGGIASCPVCGSGSFRWLGSAGPWGGGD